MTTASVSASALTAASKRALRASLWVAQALLSAAFIMAGFMKATAPIAELATQMAWVNDFATPIVRFIGVAELLGGLGLLLPSITRIKPVLTPIAASGLLAVMVLAAGYHVAKGEAALIVPNILLGALAAFIAWGRHKAAPIAPRA